METERKEVKSHDEDVIDYYDMMIDYYNMMHSLWLDLINVRSIELISSSQKIYYKDVESFLDKIEYWIIHARGEFFRESGCIVTFYQIYLYLKCIGYKMKIPELQEQIDVDKLKELIEDLVCVYGVYFGYLIGFKQEFETSLENLFDTLAFRHVQIITYISENKIEDEYIRVSLPIIPFQFLNNEFKPIITVPFFKLPGKFKYNNFRDDKKIISNFKLDTKTFIDENERILLLQQLALHKNMFMILSKLFEFDFEFEFKESDIPLAFSFLLEKLTDCIYINFFNSIINRDINRRILVYFSFLFFKYILPFIIRYYNLTDINKEKIVLVSRAMARNCVYVGHYIGMEQAYNHTTLNEAYYSFENCFLKSKLKRLQRTYSEPIKKLHENEIKERIYVGDTTFKKDVMRWNSLFLIDNKQHINAQDSVIENDLDFFDEQSNLFNEVGNILENNDYEKGFGRREIGLELDEDFYENRIEAEPVSTEETKRIEQMQKYGTVNTRYKLSILDYMFFLFNKNFWENE